MTEPHPLGQLLQDAARGCPPPADGQWRRESPWMAGLSGIVTFTGHAVLCVPDDIPDARLSALRPDGFGGAADPRLVVSLAGVNGWIDSLDLVLAASGIAGRPSLVVSRPDLAGESRAQRAAGLRSDVRVFGLVGRDDVVLTIGRGIGLLPELSFEITPDARGEGLGRRVIADARALCGPDDIVLASIAPGNVASLRAALAAGFRPIAGVQLFRPGTPDA